MLACTGLRVWRLLLQHGQLEEKTVAERAMVPPKEARSLLYTLLKAGALQLQARSLCRGWRQHSEGASSILGLLHEQTY